MLISAQCTMLNYNIVKVGSIEAVSTVDLKLKQ